MATYDKYYKEDKNYFGNPNKELLDFFNALKNKGTVVDLGAGQGRNAISLHKMGYDVTAVDISIEGLNQINKSNPAIKTILADIYTFDISNYDFILLDSMLHFYKKEFEKETKLVIDIISSMKENAVLVNCMVYSKHKELLKILNNYDNIDIITKCKFMYNTSWEYHMIAAKKISL